MHLSATFLKTTALWGTLALLLASCDRDSPTPPSSLDGVNLQFARPGDTLTLQGRFHLAEPEVYLGAVRLPLTKTSHTELRAVIPPEAGSELLQVRGRGDVLDGPLLEIYDSGWRRPFGAGASISHIQFLPGNAALGWAFGRIEGYTHHSLWHTRDGGQSWSRMEQPQLRVPELSQLQPVSASVLWASYYNQVFRSDDGGASWMEMEFELPYIEQIGFLDETTAFAVCRAVQGDRYQFYRTTDGGQHWELLHEQEHYFFRESL
ncbi:WD40/YVTN/BNR-like repeat-containing protein [Cesiribacter andamanensis]|uniref:Plant photosystem II stability/assembly factor-like protein n=1 Tax=Cesiribacter andamanensis AMV16 TaxID=1279009 RepID=M7NSF4_9BACT|nr:plant photosystem II stability/assembly factor-like protein [Cesiribacter andamanensis]EMR01409.1 plant photosystem II stability/assembly factor-like protein [Cesiribacter andamanensis AMV16]